VTLSSSNRHPEDAAAKHKRPPCQQNMIHESTEWIQRKSNPHILSASQFVCDMATDGAPPGLPSSADEKS
jgi:hypothetical protein